MPESDSIPLATRSGQPIWSEFRHQFPITERFIYLNHAAVAPLCRPAAEAMKSLTDDVLRFGALHYGEWDRTYAGLRTAAARLVGSDPSEIAIVKNTSEGVATVATGLNWRAGDKIVAFDEEFPANYLPWKRLESRGVCVELLSCTDPLDRIDKAARGARLLAISFVQYLSGFRADLNAIGEICARHGVIFFVDAIQGLGAFPLNVERARIHALAADGHKWLLGPEGCGILYVRKDIQDSIEPVEFGWSNVAAYNDFAARDLTLRPDAGRYECGTLNTVGCYGLRAAIDFLLDVGIRRIAPAVESLASQLGEGARRRDYKVLGEPSPESSSGIVSLSKPGVDSRLIVRQLKDRGLLAASRRGFIRISPHFYISPDDIGQLLEALP